MTQKYLIPSEASPEVLEQIKARYMNYESVGSIAKAFNMSPATLLYWSKKYWHKERELQKIKSLQEFLDAKKINLAKISDYSITIMTRSLEALAMRKEAPTVKEAETASRVLSTIDHITRLDSNQPTEITEEKPANVVEIQEKLKLDPFYTEGKEQNEEVIEDVKEITYEKDAR